MTVPSDRAPFRRSRSLFNAERGFLLAHMPSKQTKPKYQYTHTLRALLRKRDSERETSSKKGTRKSGGSFFPFSLSFSLGGGAAPRLSPSTNQRSIRRRRPTNGKPALAAHPSGLERPSYSLRSRIIKNGFAFV